MFFRLASRSLPACFARTVLPCTSPRCFSTRRPGTSSRLLIRMAIPLSLRLPWRFRGLVYSGRVQPRGGRFPEAYARDAARDERCRGGDGGGEEKRVVEGVQQAAAVGAARRVEERGGRLGVRHEAERQRAEQRGAERRPDRA